MLYPHTNYATQHIGTYGSGSVGTLCNTEATITGVLGSVPWGWASLCGECRRRWDTAPTVEVGRILGLIPA